VLNLYPPGTLVWLFVTWALTVGGLAAAADGAERAIYGENEEMRLGVSVWCVIIGGVAAAGALVALSLGVASATQYGSPPPILVTHLQIVGTGVLITAAVGIGRWWKAR
jgi:hypothetical protein